MGVFVKLNGNTIKKLLTMVRKMLMNMEEGKTCGLIPAVMGSDRMWTPCAIPNTISK